MSEAYRLAGTASAGDGTAAIARSAARLAPSFQYRLGHLLHEQGDTVGYAR